MSKNESKVAIITGASSGIGWCTARVFGARGYRLVLVARRTDRLEALRGELRGAGQEAVVIEACLSDVSNAERIARQALESYGRVDVLVNNAGYGMQRRFEETDPAETARMFNVNVLSPMALARAVVPHMRRRGSGSIVNVASVGGVVAHPLNVAYCASKHALVGFSKALRLELRGTGILVTAVCPGATRTEFFEVARRDIPFDRTIETWSAPADKVARTILKASHSSGSVLFPTLPAWFMRAADLCLPWLSDRENVRYRDRVLRLKPDER